MRKTSPRLLLALMAGGAAGQLRQVNKRREIIKPLERELESVIKEPTVSPYPTYEPSEVGYWDTWFYSGHDGKRPPTPDPAPTTTPSSSPSSAPTTTPSASPTISTVPTAAPSAEPTGDRPMSPSSSPSASPSEFPTIGRAPTDSPLPSAPPSMMPTVTPMPSITPFPSITAFPTEDDEQGINGDAGGPVLPPPQPVPVDNAAVPPPTSLSPGASSTGKVPGEQISERQSSRGRSPYYSQYRMNSKGSAGPYFDRPKNPQETPNPPKQEENNNDGYKPYAGSPPTNDKKYRRGYIPEARPRPPQHGGIYNDKIKHPYERPGQYYGGGYNYGYPHQYRGGSKSPYERPRPPVYRDTYTYPSQYRPTAKYPKSAKGTKGYKSYP